MPRFSTISATRLSDCDPLLIALFNYVIMFWDCSIIEGHRSSTRQLDLYEQGLTRVKVSKHNSLPSQAVDVAPYPINWNDIDRFYMFGGFVLGVAAVMGIKIRWGGDWDGDTELGDQEFNDLVHFELVQ